MKKFIIIVGTTYFVTRHWDRMPRGDKAKVKKQAQNLVYKAAQFVGRELEELDYRLAWQKFGRK